MCGRKSAPKFLTRSVIRQALFLTLFKSRMSAGVLSCSGSIECVRVEDLLRPPSLAHFVTLLAVIFGELKHSTSQNPAVGKGAKRVRHTTSQPRTQRRPQLNCTIGPVS